MTSQVEVMEPLLPCAGRCQGKPTRHRFARYASDRPNQVPLVYACKACAAERVWGNLEPNAFRAN